MQLDVTKVDHVTVIQKDRQLLVSIKKGEVTWQVTVPIASGVPVPLMQQPVPETKAVSFD
jgi:ribosomal protein L15E